ncbi:MAG: hypothetical protein WCJ64_11445 [Rhodospirillaceae bacterium]
MTQSESGGVGIDELDELFQSEEKLQELIGIEFDELTLVEPVVRKIIAQDITTAFSKAISQRPFRPKPKSQYDNKVHELYKKINKMK